jgi:5S rRNA maturation endonuclease (ribonuclease M5)
MKTMMTKKSHSFDQEKLKIVCDELCDNIEQLLDSFDLEYRLNNKLITMCCPIHNGDNISALNIYPEGERYRGNWVCRTHNCEKVFKQSIIGFIRGIISNKKYNWSKDGDQTCSFQEAINYAQSFLKKDFDKIKISKTDREKKTFTNIVNYLNKEPENNISRITRSHIIKSIQIPATYYIHRNYSPETLSKYDVGLCDKPDKPMYNRVVVPIYDSSYEYMVGCTGRSIFEKCDKCESYHNHKNECPPPDKRWLYPKWKHSSDLKSQNHLYNFWFAQKHILKSTVAIIVESPGNVWRLEENGIHNSVAIFGSSLSDRQKILLDSSGAMTLIILTDNDDAGKQAAEQIKQKCQNTYRIFIPSISKPDVGEMTKEEIKNEIVDYLEKIS